MSSDDEVAALKARLAALEGAKTAAKPKSGCGQAVGVGFLIVVGLMVVGALVGGDDDAGAPSSGPDAADIANCPREAAEAAYLAARSSGLIRGEEMSAADGAVIMVRPAAWERLSYERQKRLVAAFDCAIAGPDKHLTVVRIRYQRNTDDIAVWRSGELLELREAGYAKAAG